jgi:hypothetical protein
LHGNASDDSDGSSDETETLFRLQSLDSAAPLSATTSIEEVRGAKRPASRTPSAEEPSSPKRLDLQGGVGVARPEIAVFDHEHKATDMTAMPGVLRRQGQDPKVPKQVHPLKAANYAFHIETRVLDFYNHVVGWDVTMQSPDPRMCLVYNFGNDVVGGITRGKLDETWCCFGTGNGTVFPNAALNPDM